MELEEIHPTHFTTLRKTPFPHTLIEQKLMELGGNGVDGMAYRKQVLAAAGWPHDGLVTFSKYPDQAATVFNRIRVALKTDPDRDGLLGTLGG